MKFNKILMFITLLFVFGVFNVEAEAFTYSDDGFNIEVVSSADVDLEKGINVNCDVKMISQGYWETDIVMYPNITRINYCVKNNGAELQENYLNSSTGISVYEMNDPLRATFQTVIIDKPLYGKGWLSVDPVSSTELYFMV